jgi:hypothetical protein
VPGPAGRAAPVSSLGGKDVSIALDAAGPESSSRVDSLDGTPAGVARARRLRPVALLELRDAEPTERPRRLGV